MNGLIVSIIIGLFFLIIVGVAIIFSIILYGKEEKYENNPLIFSFLGKSSNNCAFGIEEKVETGVGGRALVTFSQRGYNPKKQKKPETVKCIVDKSKIIYLPRWTLDKNKTIKILLPQNADDFPDIMKESEFGQALQLVTEIKNAVNSEISAIKKGSEMKDEILEKLSGGEISREYLSKIDELIKDLIKIAASTKNKDNIPPYTTRGGV